MRNEQIYVVRIGGGERLTRLLQTALEGTASQPISIDALGQGLHDAAIIFAVGVDALGVSDEFLRRLRLLRQNNGCLRGSIAGIVVDGESELYSKSAAQELALAANMAGCTFLGKSLVEGTGSLYNQHILAQRMNRSWEETYFLRAKELVQRLERDGLIYAELRFAPQYHLNGGMSQEDAVLAAIAGLEQGLAECRRLKAGLILCTMNHCDPADNHAENIETVHLAKKYLGKGVVGVDMAGYEERMPEYADIFELAKKLGIPATTHSEFTVADALEYGTTRIGHGYQAALKPELTQAVIEKGITLEMCPDSSLSYEYGLTGDATHPLYVLYKQGARVTVNTDNLTVLDTCLDFEYELCRRMGFTDEDIVKMNNFAIEACFADEETKKQLLAVQPL